MFASLWISSYLCHRLKEVGNWMAFTKGNAMHKYAETFGISYQLKSCLPRTAPKKS